MAGWLKLHRTLLEWEWYGDINTTRLWLHILLKASHETKKWKGVEVPAGTLITSYSSLSRETGLTVDELRTCILRLLACKSITRETTNRYQAITVANWALYQENPDSVPSNSPDKSQPIPNPFPTSKEDKNIYRDNLLHKLSSPQPEVSGNEAEVKKGKRKPKLFPTDSDPYKSAKFMAERIIAHEPNFPQLRPEKREQTIQRWASDIDKLLRIDKADFEQFKAVLLFSQTDPFWQKNILSGKKLREQYGALLMRTGNE